MNDDFGEVKRARSPKKKIKVTYPNGSSVCNNSATLTFLDALRSIPVERLGEVSLMVGRRKLISQEIYPGLEKDMKEICRGWYVNTQSDVAQKYLQLRSINDELGLGLKLEIGEDLEVDKGRGFGKSRKTKDNLLITMPDGSFIAQESPIKTYIEFVRQIGPELIMAKGVQHMNKQLVTMCKMYPDQVELDKGLWLTVPVSTKLKYNVVMSIGIILKKKISASLI